MANSKTTVLTIKHKESTHEQEITQEDWDKLKDRVRAKYTITGKKEVATPPEVAGK